MIWLPLHQAVFTTEVCVDIRAELILVMEDIFIKAVDVANNIIARLTVSCHVQDLS